MFTIASQRKGEHWKLQEGEKDAWGTALSNVLEHVPMPEKQMGIAADIAAVGFVAYASLVPRLQLDRQLALGAAHMPPPGENEVGRVEVAPVVPFPVA